MRFEYTLYNGNWLPLVPVVFTHGKRRLPPIKALVDTGATHTILPLELTAELGIDINLDDPLESQIAGGGRCFIYAPSSPLGYLVRNPATPVEYRWTGQVFFALEQEFVLLGHHQCLEKFDVTFLGPERMLEVTARLRKR